MIDILNEYLHKGTMPDAPNKIGFEIAKSGAHDYPSSMKA